jgi:uncharacterized membrane protein required for colicin V production
MVLLALLTLLIMAIVAYVQLRDGIVGAMTACFATLVSGMLATQLWPFLANQIGVMVGDGFEDAIALVLVFCLSLAVIRLAASTLVKHQFGIRPRVNQVGAILFGLLTGYLASGFLVCVLQTLPWHENLLGFRHVEDGFAGQVFPSDQAWLGLMNHAHRGSFAPGEDQSKYLREFSKSFVRERRYSSRGQE